VNVKKIERFIESDREKKEGREERFTVET